MNIGHVLKGIRLEQNKKQGDVAALCGITQSYLSQIERGGRNVEMKTFKKLAKIYKTPTPFVLWLSIELKDVPANKRPLFKQLKPMVDNMILNVKDPN